MRQEVYNHAGVLESGNSINQINDQSQSGFDVDQYSRNVMAMAGAGNTLSQTNLAEAWGSNIDPSQKNLMGALGCGNRKTQMNSTNASSSLGEKEASANQSQSNLGVLLMDTNDLNQYNNTAAATGNDLNPTIDQTDKNLALMVGVDPTKPTQTPNYDWISNFKLLILKLSPSVVVNPSVSVKPSVRCMTFP